MQTTAASQTKWPTSAQEAVAIQHDLRHRVSLSYSGLPPQTIAGIDVGYDKEQKVSRCAIVVLSYPELVELHSVTHFKATPFPYVPGLLSFREAPVIMESLALLSYMPDILMIDGHGIAHPRRLGIAAHIGVLTDCPAIGVAKKRLCGAYTQPDIEKGSASPLMDGDTKIGTVLRSRKNVKPVFVSPGHKMDHENAINIVKSCLTRYRLPEPTRLADKLSKMIKAQI